MIPNRPFFSICIPSYSRPKDVCRAVSSCLKQTESFEILIGDDTADDSVEEMLGDTFPNEPRLHYCRNLPALGQAANVDRLYHQAVGDWLVLLHDDDFLTPGSLASFEEHIIRYPGGDLFYGKQILVQVDGSSSPSTTETFNNGYRRIASRTGISFSSKEDVLYGQIPSNGFCVRAKIAQHLGYPGLKDSGDACDLAFSINLAINNVTFVFLDVFVSGYVLSTHSVARNNPKYDSGYRALSLVSTHFADLKHTLSYKIFFASHVGEAILHSLYRKEKALALQYCKEAWGNGQLSKLFVVKQLIKCYLPPYFLFGTNLMPWPVNH